MAEIKLEPNYAEACPPETSDLAGSPSLAPTSLRPPPTTTTHGSVSSSTPGAGPREGCPGRQVAV